MKTTRTAWALRGGIETDWQCESLDPIYFGMRVPHLYGTRDTARYMARNADIKLTPVRVRVTVEVEEI